MATVSPLAAFDLVVGFDTEYVAESATARSAEVFEEDPEVLVQRGNRVLCISYALLDPHTGGKWSGMVTVEPIRKRRWSLKQFLEQVLIAAMDLGVLTPERMRAADERRPKRECRGLKICLVAHFTRADLPGFSDFKQLKKKFSAVRKTYVTIQRPHVFTARPRNFRAKTSVTLRDTRLLAPAGYGSLSAIGDMLGYPKLTVPDVMTSNGETVHGITRMDLVQERHPKAFEAYALRDAELAVDFLSTVSGLAGRWGASKVPATIGSLGVEAFIAGATDFAGYCGRVVEPGSYRKLVLHPILAAHMGLWANAFRGGRNEAFAHGLFDAPEGRCWNDIDLASAYTTVMAGIPPIDWNAVSMPTKLSAIAVLDAAVVAQIRFRFPRQTKFPCLPVPAGSGLIFPREGETTTTGAEILAAINMGAEIEVVTALRFEFRQGVHEFAGFSQMIAAERARYKVENPVFEKLVKEAGNSVYGKTAQAVAGMRSVDPDRSRYFDTQSGSRLDLPQSRLTNPVHAALTTSILRAVVSEILSNLPQERVVLSVTTDGFLTDATLDEALDACDRPLTSWFKRALAIVAPDKSLLEIKHQATKVIVARTRGAFTVTAPDSYKGAPILARAGHRLEDFSGTAWEEARTFAEIFFNRTPALKLPGRDLISVERQWMEDADLVSIPTMKRVNLDYDMGGIPMNPKEVNGVLQFFTEPWQTKRAYEAGRKALDQLRKNGGHLKTICDWQGINAKVSRAANSGTQKVQTSAASWMRAQVALGLCGKSKPLSAAQGAAALTEIGVATTTKQLQDAAKNARARGIPARPPGLSQTAEIESMRAAFGISSKSKHSVRVLQFLEPLISLVESCPN